MRTFTTCLVLAIGLALGLLAPGTSASGQTTTGALSGRVTDSQGLALPGVTVNVSSPSLQGVRSAVTSENGDYIVPQVPSGDYTVTFELSGFEKVSKSAKVA